MFFYSLFLRKSYEHEEKCPYNVPNLYHFWRLRDVQLIIILYKFSNQNQNFKLVLVCY